MSPGVSPTVPDLGGLVRAAAGAGIALHSVEVSHGGDLLVSAAAAPVGPLVPHRMYSVAKTVTALAVGVLVGDGRLALDARVVDHFPELVPVHRWVAATTVHDLLTMRGPHAATTWTVTDGPWLDSWFRVPPTHPPGTLFTYDTSGSYVLGALVHRVAGVGVTDLLRPQVLDPLGIADTFRVLPGPQGTEHGGSGLVCTPRDLLRLTHLLLDRGVHDDEVLVPPDFVGSATTRQVDTSALTWGPSFRGGYGYQTWTSDRGGFLMFGLGGQIAYGLPEADLAVVVTADAQAYDAGDRRLVELVLDHLVGPVAPDRIPVRGKDGRRTGPVDPADPADLPWPAPAHDPRHAVDLRGRASRVAGTGPDELDLELGASTGHVADTAGELALRYDVTGPTAQTVGRDERPCVVTAGWSDPRTLDLRSWLLGTELAARTVRLHVDDDGTVAVRSEGFGETVDPAWTTVGTYSPRP